MPNDNLALEYKISHFHIELLAFTRFKKKNDRLARELSFVAKFICVCESIDGLFM